MQRDHAPSHPLKRDSRKTGNAHHLRKYIRTGEAANGLHEVAVGRRIAGDHAPKRRNDLERVGVVQPIKARNIDGGEFKAEKSAADAQHAIDLGERQLNPRDIANTECDGDGIIASVTKRQHLAATLNESYTVTALGRPCPSDLEHLA